MSPVKDEDKTIGSLEKSLETEADRKRRLRSVFITHLSMLLSGFGNSLIYIGMYPYIYSVNIQQYFDFSI